MKAAKALILLAVLGACQAPPEAIEDPVYQDTDSGLVEREPDICGASAYQNAIGQPQSVIPTLGVTREVRVVPKGAIVSQIYEPYRMNFYLDGAGTITRVSCG